MMTNANEALNETLEYNIVTEQWDTGVALSGKAMKSSPLLGPFGDSEFWEFSLLKI